MTTANSREWSSTVIRNVNLGSNYSLLELALPKSFPQPKAGSFCMMSAGDSRDILLRRPMAFFDVQKQSTYTQVDILYRVVGRGTHQFSQLNRGAVISLFGPIGNAFSKPQKGEHFLVAAGGIGISPFRLWGRQLKEPQKKRARLLFGFPTEKNTSLTKLFRQTGLKPICSVEAATTSFKGTVLDLLKAEFDKAPATRILTCGPEPMMRAVLGFAHERKVPCELSMEARMACGMGVCLSCVTSIKPTESDRYALVCQDGPIFSIDPPTGQPKRGAEGSIIIDENGRND